MADKKNILLQLDPELFRAVDDFRFERRVMSRAEALRILLWSGLERETQADPEDRQRIPA